tara:strand:- start:5092 stop:6270 length:1179 start_codon:yes stop_codon:yes gene_type:complete
MLAKIINYVDFRSINSSVKYLSISALFTGIALGFFFTLVVIVAKYKGFSEGIIGIIAGSFSLGLMSAGFIVSLILDKIGLYRTMLFAISIQTISVIIMFIFFNPINLIINHFIMGIFGGMIWMTMDTWVNLVSDNKNRGKAIAFYNSAISFGFAIGPLFIGFFGSKGTIPIIVAIILMIIRTPVMILIKEQVNNVKIPKLEKKIKFSFLKIAPFIFVAIFISGTIDSSFGALFPAFMINEFFSDKEIGYIFFIGMFFGVFCQPFVGALTDKINKRNLMFFFLIFHLIWPLLLNNFISYLTIVCIAIIIWGIASISLYTVALAYLGERVKTIELSIATSVFIIIFEFGEFLGPITVGFIMDMYGNIGFIYSIISFTIFAVFIGILRTIFKKIK